MCPLPSAPVPAPHAARSGPAARTGAGARAPRGWRALAAALLALTACREPPAPAPAETPPHRAADAPPKYVAHARNSLEDLDRAAGEGHTFVEVDLSWTTDRHLVLLHDWGPTLQALHGVAPGVRSLDEWRALPPRSDGATSLDVPALGDWMARHPEVSIVTDVKTEEAAGHAVLAAALPGLLGQFVAQVHDEEQAEAVAALGFSRLVLTLYVSQLPDEQVLELTGRLPLLAVTMPRARVAGLLPRRLSELGVPSYGHPFEDHLSLSRQLHRGLSGGYTGRLSPARDEWAAAHTDDWTMRRAEVVPHDAQVLVLDAPVLGREGATFSLGVPPGGPLREVRLTGYSADGRVVGSYDLLLTPGVRRGSLGFGAAFPGEPPAWIAAPADVATSLCWDLHELPPLCRHSTLEPARRWTATGSGAHLAGVQLSVLNPGDRPVTWTLEHDVGAGPVRGEPRDLPPRHVQTHLLPFETDGPVRITVTGGPVVVQALRGDPTLTYVR